MTGRATAAAQRCLDTIERLNPQVNAFVTVTAEQALEAAAAADRAEADGRWLGLLHGMPVTVKDNLDTAGVATTHGSLYYKDNVPNRDAETVRLLRQAGAVILGKATMHEFAFGIRSVNPVVGQCRNPWDLSRVPGGSSGGSGATVAAEMCVGSLGSDTGGSVRLPAAINGVVGLRPTHGRFSGRGMSKVSPTHDTVGPLAKRVEDVARMFAALTGYDPEDPLSADRPLENFLPTLHDGIEGVRIGMPRNFYFEQVDPEVEAAVRAAAAELARQGARLVEVDVPEAAEAQEALRQIVLADVCLEHGELLKQGQGLMERQTWERMSGGLKLTGVEYARAMRFREAWRRSLARLFHDCDVLLAPTLTSRVPPVEEDRHLTRATLDATRNTYAGALGGIPGLSLPCGFASDGLPVGVQLEAAWWREPLLLRIGAAYQRATDWHTRRPTLLQ